MCLINNSQPQMEMQGTYVTQTLLHSIYIFDNCSVELRAAGYIGYECNIKAIVSNKYIQTLNWCLCFLFFQELGLFLNATFQFVSAAIFIFKCSRSWPHALYAATEARLLHYRCAYIMNEKLNQENISFKTNKITTEDIQLLWNFLGAVIQLLTVQTFENKTYFWEPTFMFIYFWLLIWKGREPFLG